MTVPAHQPLPKANVKPLSTLIALLTLSLSILSSATLADSNAKPIVDKIHWPSCINGLQRESAAIERITDGDTVVLSDRRRVRLIGINSAELNAQTPKLKGAAQQATDQLKAWLPPGEAVSLYLGEQSTDRHGRVLAHVIRAKDGLAVAQAMVQKGLAVQSAVAPTTKCTAHFVALENQAIAANHGLWRIRELMSVSASKRHMENGGFKLISGTVTSVKRKKRFTQVILENRFHIKVRPKLAKTLSLDALIGQDVEVRGWLSTDKNRAQLWLQHAANLSVLEN